MNIQRSGSRLNYNSASALRAFLEQEGLGMQKKFGQNFLINPQVRNDLAAALNAPSGSEVWEIGPGLGAMTELLLEKNLKVKAFEIDLGFIRSLKKIFSGSDNLSLIEGDVMKTWQGQECADTSAAFLLGNLPYNIAAALLADFIEKGKIFTRMVVTVQKEVALRMSAFAGTKDYSSFSVLCASAYKIKPLMTIKRESFFPQPNVDSMGVLLEGRFNESGEREKYPACFYPLVRALFASRRKTVKNNLLTFISAAGSFAGGSRGRQSAHLKERAGLCSGILRENAVNENERAENLELNTFLSIAKSIDNVRI